MYAVSSKKKKTDINMKTIVINNFGIISTIGKKNLLSSPSLMDKFDLFWIDVFSASKV
tara:strand:+ start:3204 stop:3377 length:174 start_codon:yes stop_codon:yes gene_type:complete